MALKVGFMTAGLSGRDVAALEASGVDSLWAGGHVTTPGPTHEVMMSFARIATLTERVTVGTAIVALPLYPPAVIAKQVADVDRWTGGRVMLGIGVGGEYPEEFVACGVPRSERGARANEAVALLRELWTGEKVTYEGRFYAMEGVHLDPPPVQPGGPPVLVAGRRDAAIRRAALLGDGWMPYLYSASKYARSVEAIREQADAAGRDLSSFHWTASIFVTVGDTREQARHAAARGLAGTLRAEGNPDFGGILDRVAVAGDTDDVIGALLAFVEAGAEHLILTPTGFDDRHEGCLRIMQDIVPHLRAKVLG
jgi:probable F420-dependent oxidoreductase